MPPRPRLLTRDFGLLGYRIGWLLAATLARGAVPMAMSMVKTGARPPSGNRK